MTFKCVSLFLAVSAILCEGRYNKYIKFIVGGNTSDVYHVPYLAIITHNENYRCGASIIDKFWLLTAAHCVQEQQSGYSIRLGTSYKYSGGSQYKIVKVITYPSDNKESLKNDIGFNNDIALIKLNKPIRFKKKQRSIPLARPEDTKLVTGRKMQVSGFGAMNEEGIASRVLRTAFVPIIDQEQCRRLYYYDPPSDQVFCAGYVDTGGVDSCFGDSGGPAVLDGKLIGIVMGGDGCALPGYPGIYTKVSAFYDWIIENTGLYMRPDTIIPQNL